MKYLALLSGGKDSCYNLLHCAKNGHELVAAASLGPEAGKEELDSYLYQTVGQDAIEFVARALDVPLYRRVITGNAVERGSEYGSRNAKDAVGIDGDETEDLFALLSTVKYRHPGIQGVSVGAILSNYQRVRVEHVCRRLGLTPLCYLWQRDQRELLAEMISARMEAVLIKVAGIGLTTKHLGMTLANIYPTLVKLNDLYGSHVCGEGGEYESLTLDCPLFKHRIVLTEVETIIHSDNDFATVAFLRIKNATLEQKAPIEPFNLATPPLLEDGFITVRDAVLQSQSNVLDVHDSDHAEPKLLDEPIIRTPDSVRVGPWVSVSNIQRKLDDKPTEISIEEEVAECFSLLEECLAKYDLYISNCTNINIFLSSMDLFARANAMYSSFFGSSPPARACVAIDLPPSIRVRLDCTALVEKNHTERQSLHVQSLSYWAPANIGPYSQAITARERIFISGQIGLIPSSLHLPSPPSFAIETALASQHVARVTDALRSNSGGGWVGHTQITIYWLTDNKDLPHIKEAHHALPKAHKEVDAPTLFLTVKALPKEALVEKQVLLHSGRFMVADSYEDDVSLQTRRPVFEKGDLHLTDGATIHWEVSRFDDGISSCAIICVRGIDHELLPDALSELMKATGLVLSHSLGVRLFYIPSRLGSFPSVCDTIFHHERLPPTTPIPCRSISTIGEDDWDYVICVLSF